MLTKTPLHIDEVRNIAHRVYENYVVVQSWSMGLVAERVSEQYVRAA
jgi:hypothetical protein